MYHTRYVYAMGLIICATLGRYVKISNFLKKTFFFFQEEFFKITDWCDNLQLNSVNIIYVNIL